VDRDFGEIDEAKDAKENLRIFKAMMVKMMVENKKN
jgi:hypothetical protein